MLACGSHHPLSESSFDRRPAPTLRKRWESQGSGQVEQAPPLTYPAFPRRPTTSVAASLALFSLLVFRLGGPLCKAVL